MVERRTFFIGMFLLAQRRLFVTSFAPLYRHFGANPRIGASNILEDLNESQEKAVLQETHAITRVIAGPGSGKTRVLTSRIAHLLASSNDRILAVTFTKKASMEMQRRLKELVDDEETLWRVTLGTFHSICAKLLRWHGDLLSELVIRENGGMNVTLDSGFTICDSSEQLRVLKDCLDEEGINLGEMELRPFAVLSALGQIRWKAPRNNEKVSKARRVARRIKDLYFFKLYSSNRLDFDDLIYWSRHLLHQHPEIRKSLTLRWPHVLVDEFQDTSKAQLDLVQLWTSQSLFVVGDADQSIYSWRGAHTTSLRDLENDFPSIETIYLMENYRSTGNIIKAAQRVISASDGAETNPLRQDMKPKRDEGVTPRVVSCEDDRAEADFVVTRARDIFRAGSEATVAVIYRTNAQSRALEEACVKYNVPYMIFGSATSFYKRQEIADCLAYLKCLYSGGRDSLPRVLKTPSKGIGPKALEELDDYYGRTVAYHREFHPEASIPTPLDVILSLGIVGAESNGPQPSDTMSSRTVKAVAKFATQMQVIVDLAQNQTVEQVLSRIVSDMELLSHFNKISKTDAEYAERCANLNELKRAAERYKGPAMVAIDTSNEEDILGIPIKETPLGNFLDDVALVTDMAESEQRDDSSRNVMNLMTIHASKGMEFDIVYVVGNEDGTFPTSQSLEEDAEAVLEEERRLCYVAMTRAKSELVMTWRKEVPIFTKAGIRRINKDRSRFLDVLVSKKKSQGSASALNQRKPTAGRGNGYPPSSYRQSGRSSWKKKPPVLVVEKQPTRSMSGTASVYKSRSGPRPPNTMTPNSPPRPQRREPSQISTAKTNRVRKAVPSSRGPGVPPPPAPFRPDEKVRQQTSAAPPKKEVNRSQSHPSSTRNASETKKTRPQSRAAPMDSTWFYPVGTNVKHPRLGSGVIVEPPSKDVVKVQLSANEKTLVVPLSDTQDWQLQL